MHTPRSSPYSSGLCPRRVSVPLDRDHPTEPPSPREETFLDKDLPRQIPWKESEAEIRPRRNMEPDSQTGSDIIQRSPPSCGQNDRNV